MQAAKKPDDDENAENANDENAEETNDGTDDATGTGVTFNLETNTKTEDDEEAMLGMDLPPTSASKMSIGKKMLSASKGGGKKVGRLLMKSMHASKMVKKKDGFKQRPGGPLSVGLLDLDGAEFGLDSISTKGGNTLDESQIPTDIGSLYTMVTGDLNRIRAELRVFIQSELARVAKASSGSTEGNDKRGSVGSIRSLPKQAPKGLQGAGLMAHGVMGSTIPENSE